MGKLHFLFFLLLICASGFSQKPAWKSVPTGMQGISAFAALPNGEWIAVGNNSKTGKYYTHRSSDRGKTWVQAELPRTLSNFSVSSRGEVFGYDNSGVWLITGDKLRRVFGSHDGKLSFNSKGDMIFISPAGIHTWYRSDSKPHWQIAHSESGEAILCGIVGPDDRVRVSTEKGLFLLSQDGKTLEQEKHVPPSPIYQMAYTQEGVLVGMISGQEILYQKDPSEPWEKLESNVRPKHFRRIPGTNDYMASSYETFFLIESTDKKPSLRPLDVRTEGDYAADYWFPMGSREGGISLVQYNGKIYRENLPTELHVTIEGMGEVLIHNKESESLFRVKGNLSIERDFFTNDRLLFEAKPLDGYRFEGWKGIDSAKSEAELVLTKKRVDITAVFVKDK